MNKKHFRMVSGTALAIMLAACGGGGGDEDTSPTTPTPTTPSPVVTPGIPITYVAGSAQATALEYVNRSITHCGYNPMTPAQDLSGAAQSHASYVALDGFKGGHEEIPGKPGFTGETHRERIKAAGGSEARAWNSSEGVGSLGIVMGRAGVNLLAAPLHQADMLSQWSEVGVGTSPHPDGPGSVLVLNYGGERLNTVPAHGVRTFPCEGTVDLAGQGGPERPDPFPGLNGLFGPGLNFETNKNGAIVVDSISLRNEATGQMVPLMEVKGFGMENTPWRSMYSSQGYLTDNTSYRVEAKGKAYASRNGNEAPVAWERNYSFRTF